MTEQVEPVKISGSVEINKMPERYVTTRTSTFILVANDPNGAQLIRPRTRQNCQTTIVALPNAGGTNAGYGWIATSLADAERQKGCFIRGDFGNPVVLYGQNELYAMADPASTGASLTISVYNEVEGSN